MNSIPVLGTEPASENRIRSCCGSMPGIRFYCKPVTLVRCWEIRGENRFSGRVGGKWLCEMLSAFIIKELRGAWALRLFCGRSAFPPPCTETPPSGDYRNPGWGLFLCPLAVSRSPYKIVSIRLFTVGRTVGKRICAYGRGGREGLRC